MVHIDASLGAPHKHAGARRSCAHPINVRDALGFMPLLLLAISGGTTDIAELLIRKGCDINARTWKGETPLSLAQNAQCTEMLEMSISKCAKS
jgi:ankyrin repeat protein